MTLSKTERTEARSCAGGDPSIGAEKALLDRCLRPMTLVVAIVAALVVLAHAGLLPAGRWQDDEYLLFTTIRRWGWSALPSRLLYSPRPFSEVLLAFYGRAVLASHRPLVVIFLALLWAALVCSTLLAVRATLPRDKNRTLTAIAISASILAHWLTTNPISELFFWPMASAAYLPLLAGASVVCVLASQTVANRSACCTALTVAALSSEIGAVLAISFAACAATISGRIDGADSSRSSGRVWWLVPGAVGAGVIVALLSYRAGLPERIAIGGAYTGHPYASIAASSRELLEELSGNGLVLATRLCLAGGVFGLFATAASRPDPRWPLAVATALLIACFFSLAAAFDHYGRLCCERQQALRGCLLDLVFISVAIALLGRVVRRPSQLAAAISLVLLLFSTTSVLPRLHALVNSYTMLHWSIDARVRTWSSGRQPDRVAMVFYLPPDTKDEVVRGAGPAIGLYGDARSVPGLVGAVAGFFDKRQVRVCQPWQTNRSWVIGGVFFPACPDP